jgi:hypothetical protein
MNKLSRTITIKQQPGLARYTVPWYWYCSNLNLVLVNGVHAVIKYLKEFKCFINVSITSDELFSKSKSRFSELLFFMTFINLLSEEDWILKTTKHNETSRTSSLLLLAANDYHIGLLPHRKLLI